MQNEGRKGVEKRRGTVFESKVERKWRRRRRRRLGSNARFVVRRRNSRPSTTGASRIYGRALLSLSLSLSYWVRRIRPNARKKRNLHERTWALRCIAVVTDASKEIFFFSLCMKTSKRFFHHGLIQCLLTWYITFSPCIVYADVPHTSYNVSTIFLQVSLLPLNVECSSNDSMEIRFVSHFDLALYSAVGI